MNRVLAGAVVLAVVIAAFAAGVFAGIAAVHRQRERAELRVYDMRAPARRMEQ